MSAYDDVADRYDEHFRRPVDRWEDARLTALLRPYVDGQNVVDLGCGTGWVADHLRPRRYVGVDASAPMLARLQEKHPTADVEKADLWDPAWVERSGLDQGLTHHTIVATWAAHDFPAVAILRDACRLVTPGGYVCLHGQAPAYTRRKHYILNGADHRQGYRRWTVERLKRATRMAAEQGWPLEWVGAHGTGARDAGPWLLWVAANLVTYPSDHYAFLAIWRKPDAS